MPWLDLSEDILCEFAERAALFVDEDAIASGFHDTGAGTVSEKKSEYNKYWRETNRDAVAYAKREWKAANRDRDREQAREYAKNNPDKIAAKKARYRQRLKALNGPERGRMTLERARAVRDGRASGKTYRQLALEFGVSYHLIEKICTGKRWAEGGDGGKVAA